MKPDCYKCVHRLGIPGDCHSRCNNHEAHIGADPDGVAKGWFIWPVNFDPVWLNSCTGFSDKEEDRKPRKELDPLIELIAMLR